MHNGLTNNGLLHNGFAHQTQPPTLPQQRGKMGLSDLKKNAMPSSSIQPSLSLDEFIEAANLYAIGQSLNKTKSSHFAF